jgi:creatinine amidohydrolase
MTRPVFMSEIPWVEYRRRLHEEDAIVMLPVGACEQHGPHLPLGTDMLIMEGYLARVLERLPTELAVVFLPVQAIGTSQEHSAFAGTLSLTDDAALRAWAALGESVARTGCRKLVLLNSHGGNSALLDRLALDLRVRLNLLAVTASWARFGYPDGLFSSEEVAHGIHAGEIETSLMLAFRPDLVRMDAAKNFAPASLDFERDFAWLRTARPAGFGWMAQDLSSSGAVGNAAAASAEKGEAAADYGATAFIELLQDVEAFDLARLDDGPG